MKRKVCTLILFACLGFLYAGNLQKQYDISSYEWHMVSRLCIMAGVVGPSSVGPVSGDELIIALDRIDFARLDSYWQDVYEELRNEVENPFFLLDYDGFDFSGNLLLGAEMYAQTQDDFFLSNNDWYIDYINRIPMFGIPLELGISDMFYGMVDLEFMPWFSNPKWSSAAADKVNPFSDVFYFNWLALRNGSIQRCIPFEAGLSGGTDFAHFFIGRGKQSIGNGYTGNLMTGDNFSYQDFAKIAFHNSVFTYNMSLTHYDQQTRSLISGYPSGSGTELDNFSFSGMHQVRTVQSYVITPVRNLSIGLHFGTLFQSDSAFDFRMVNPFMFMHNYFNFAQYNGGEKIEANNHFTLTFEYVPLPCWQLTGQIIIDQFQLANESQGLNGANALGFLLNTTYEIPLSNGVVSPYFEAVYTTPTLYLNQKYTNVDGSIISHEPGDGLDYYDWNQDLIVGYSLWWGNELNYIGYKYGPDSMVFSLGVEYIVPKVIEINGFILFRMHGEKGIAWTDTDNHQSATIEETDNAWDIWLTGTKEYMLQFTLEASYQMTDWLRFRSSITHYEKFNNRNIEGAYWNNTQFTFGCILDVAGMF